VLTLASSWYDPPVRIQYQGTFVSDQNCVIAQYDGKTGKERLEATRRRLFNNGFRRLLKTDDSTVELSLMYLRQTGSV
ncbi:MAG: radical SAM, partial [Candidatus Methanomethylophilus sp.]|nr:radical SAM [Methanomethylophilus sp.]